MDQGTQQRSQQMGKVNLGEAVKMRSDHLW
jgi:hypothetical protein